MNILWNTKHITKFTKLIQISIQTLLSLKKILLYLYTYLSVSNTIYTKYEKKNKKNVLLSIPIIHHLQLFDLLFYLCLYTPSLLVTCTIYVEKEERNIKKKRLKLLLLLHVGPFRLARRIYSVARDSKSRYRTARLSFRNNKEKIGKRKEKRGEKERNR